MNELFALASGYGQGRLERQGMEEEQRRWDAQQAMAERQQAFNEQQAQLDEAYRRESLAAQVKQWGETNALDRQGLINEWWMGNAQLSQRGYEISHRMRVDWAQINHAGIALRQAQQQFEHGRSMDWARYSLDDRRLWSDMETAKYTRFGLHINNMIAGLQYDFENQSGPMRLEILKQTKALGEIKLGYEQLRVPVFAELIKAEVESAKAQARELSARADLTQAQRVEMLGTMQTDIAYKQAMIQKLESGDPATAQEAVREMMAQRMMQSPEFRAEAAGLGDREALEKTRVQLRSEKRSMESAVYKALKEAGITDIAITESQGQPVFVRVGSDGQKEVLDLEALNAELLSRQAPEVAPLLEEYLDLQEQYRGANDRVYQFDQQARAMGISFPGMSEAQPKKSDPVDSVASAFSGASAEGMAKLPKIPVGSELVRVLGSRKATTFRVLSYEDDGRLKLGPRFEGQGPGIIYVKRMDLEGPEWRHQWRRRR